MGLPLENIKVVDFTQYQQGTVCTEMLSDWGADVINMSVAPEAILANEAGIPYAAVAMSTDYDCWKEDEEPVSWEEILKVFGENVEKVTKLLLNTITKVK